MVRLPAGEYVVDLDSTPSQRVPLTLISEENVTLTLARDGDFFHHRASRVPAAYSRCDGPAAEPTWYPVPARIE